ncbi:MAG: DUF1080 domain-containing protein, partial [Planctomycetia bacterium]|nr:DUF1080 domain-containing protein [Planctomycetia bacterium]
MTTRWPRPIVAIRDIWPCAVVLATLMFGIARADEPAPKTPEGQPAVKQPEEKAAEPQSPAKDPEPKADDKKPPADPPKPEPAENKPAPDSPKPEPPKPEPAKPEPPKPEPSKPEPADSKPPVEEAKPKTPEEKPVDVDQTRMGEFVGAVAVSHTRFEQMGLQIRPIGGGGFEGVLYSGGLPALERRKKPPTTLIGRRNGNDLVLSGARWAIFVEPDHCLLLDSEGRQAGRLDRVVRESPTMGAKPPAGAIVLFDGTGTQQFTEARMTEDGLLMEGASIKPMFQDFNLHLEFLIPYMPTATGQGRGNSGVYLQSSYEVQILDSFALVPQDNDCGSLYEFRAPDVNMCFPPLAWQTYDIAFTAARWNADHTKRGNARITVWHNGVKVQDNVEVPDKTGAGKPEEPILTPIRLQEHGSPVRFRNLWIIDRGAGGPGRFPPRPEPSPDESVVHNG